MMERLIYLVLVVQLPLFWLGTAIAWFIKDRRVKPLRLRAWRAVTWLPYTLRNLVRWGP